MWITTIVWQSQALCPYENQEISESLFSSMSHSCEPKETNNYYNSNTSMSVDGEKGTDRSCTTLRTSEETIVRSYVKQMCYLYAYVQALIPESIRGTKMPSPTNNKGYIKDPTSPSLTCCRELRLLILNKLIQLFVLVRNISKVVPPPMTWRQNKTHHITCLKGFLKLSR